MSEAHTIRLSRREWILTSAFAGGAWLTGFDALLRPREAGGLQDGFAGGKPLGVVDFAGESPVPMEKVFGAGLDGRMYTDVSKLTLQESITPTDKFYIRSRASDLLEGQNRWLVRVNGLVSRPFEWGIEDLKKMARPMGAHLMECAGNARTVHFGLMSVADWTGAALDEILATAKAKPQATRVLISGFDTYTAKSVSSVPGASWIFTVKDLKSAKAFLATEMNGSPLTKDHGAPVRLVVPGWYGCVCIKWVDEIKLVDDGAEATSQMQEFATRTQQRGVPQLARDFEPAIMDQAAMPVRIEKWLVDGHIRYRVAGILWGGRQVVKTLEIRFNPDEDYLGVDSFSQRDNDPWSFWTHVWTPKQPGMYMIRLRIKEPRVVARRLDAGYYLRTVEVAEV